MKRSPLTRAPMKRGNGNPIPMKVRRAVAQRSEGLCEVGGSQTPCSFMRWRARATDMHHLVKRPRLHAYHAIVHLCRHHHAMCDWPYAKGRLVFGDAPLQMASLPWRIVRASSKWAKEDTEIVASGTIRL